MNYGKFKANSYCFGWTDHSSTGAFEADAAKTGQILLTGKGDRGNKKTMIDCDNTISAESPGIFF